MPNKMFDILWGLFEDILLKGYMPNLESLFPDGPSKLLESNRAILAAIETRDSEKIKTLWPFMLKEKIFLKQHS